MKRTLDVKSDALRGMATILGTELKEIKALQKLKNGSKLESNLYMLEVPNGTVLNISDCKTYLFDTKEEAESYIEELFDTFRSEREFFKAFLKITDEDWEEWNK